ncbi:MAG: hypothetical protein FWB93_01540 [Oscillospiraceae bacterium]|nr:hypothetical protein [Oscillospiraceae bacterium]
MKNIKKILLLYSCFMVLYFLSFIFISFLFGGPFGWGNDGNLHHLILTRHIAIASLLSFASSVIIVNQQNIKKQLQALLDEKNKEE